MYVLCTWVELKKPPPYRLRRSTNMGFKTQLSFIPLQFEPLVPYRGSKVVSSYPHHTIYTNPNLNKVMIPSKLHLPATFATPPLHPVDPLSQQDTPIRITTPLRNCPISSFEHTLYRKLDWANHLCEILMVFDNLVRSTQGTFFLKSTTSRFHHAISIYPVHTQYHLVANEFITSAQEMNFNTIGAVFVFPPPSCFFAQSSSFLSWGLISSKFLQMHPQDICKLSHNHHQIADDITILFDILHSTDYSLFFISPLHSSLHHTTSHLFF